MLLNKGKRKWKKKKEEKEEMLKTWKKNLFQGQKGQKGHEGWNCEWTIVAEQTDYYITK